MTTKERAESKARRIEQAMFPLIGDTRFLEFIAVIRELKEEAVGFMITHDSVKSDRATLSAIGEVRAYTDILGVADNYQQQRQAQEDLAAEQAEQEPK